MMNAAAPAADQGPGIQSELWKSSLPRRAPRGALRRGTIVNLFANKNLNSGILAPIKL